MKCQKEWVREAFPEYLADGLSLERTRKIREHLEECDECRRELNLIRQFADDPVQEPPEFFFSTLPGRVTSSSRDQRERLYRLPVRVWAGGLTAAALVILLILSPWKMYRSGVKIPAGYYTQMAGTFELGLEEEILSVSGLKAEDLDRSIEREISMSKELYSLVSLDDMNQFRFYEGMDDDTLRAFERLIDDLSRVSS